MEHVAKNLTKYLQTKLKKQSDGVDLKDVRFYFLIMFL